MKKVSRGHIAVVGAMATVLAAAVVLPALAAGSTTNQSAASPAMLEAMQRDLGLTTSQANARLGQEQAAVAVADQVRQQLGAAQAGYWFDAASGKLAVAVTDQATADRVSALGAVPKLVRHSRSDLDRITASVAKLAGNGVTGLNGWGVDTTNNAVVITVNRLARNADTDAFLAKAKALSEMVQVAEKTSSPVQQSGTVEGGNPWWPGTESNCSVAFPVTDASGGKHFLSAGHCTNNADQPAYGASGQQNQIGTSNVGGNHSINAAEGDFGLIDVDQPGWNLSSTVNGWGSGDITVSGSAEAVKGQSVCHSGNTSHWQCGTVTDVNQSIDYGNGLVINGLTITSACSEAGDSGGAWLTGNNATGIHSGGSSSCGGSDQDSIFQPVSKALAKWSLALVTGGTPPPTSTTTAPPTTTTTTVPPTTTTTIPPGGKVTVANPGGQFAFKDSNSFAVQIRATATDGGALTFSATGLPPGLSISANGRISGTASATGTYSVTVTASEANGNRGTTTFGYQVWGF